MAKVWLITGSGNGLGRDIAEAALAAGDSVVAGARRTQELAPLVAQYGERVKPVALEVCEEAAAKAAVQLAVDTFGRLDVLVNNAGYGHEGILEESPLAELIHQFEVNVFGAVAMIKAVLPAMRRRRRGHIINITSMAGYIGMPGSRTTAAVSLPSKELQKP